MKKKESDEEEGELSENNDEIEFESSDEDLIYLEEDEELSGFGVTPTNEEGVFGKEFRSFLHYMRNRFSLFNHFEQIHDIELKSYPRISSILPTMYTRNSDENDEETTNQGVIFATSEPHVLSLDLNAYVVCCEVSEDVEKKCVRRLFPDDNNVRYRRYWSSISRNRNLIFMKDNQVLFRADENTIVAHGILPPYNLYKTIRFASSSYGLLKLTDDLFLVFGGLNNLEIVSYNKGEKVKTLKRTHLSMTPNCRIELSKLDPNCFFATTTRNVVKKIDFENDRIVQELIMDHRNEAKENKFVNTIETFLSKHAHDESPREILIGGSVDYIYFVDVRTSEKLTYLETSRHRYESDIWCSLVLKNRYVLFGHSNGGVSIFQLPNVFYRNCGVKSIARMPKVHQNGVFNIKLLDDTEALEKGKVKIATCANDGRIKILSVLNLPLLLGSKWEGMDSKERRMYILEECIETYEECGEENLVRLRLLNRCMENIPKFFFIL